MLALVAMDTCHGNPDAKRLYDDLLKKSGYNKLVRPVGNYSEAVKVKFGLKFAQLNDVVKCMRACVRKCSCLHHILKETIQNITIANTQFKLLINFKYSDF